MCTPRIRQRATYLRTYGCCVHEATRQLFSPVLSLSISHGCVPTFFLTLFLEHEKNAQLTRYRQRHTWTKQTTRTASWKAGREGRVETAETESSRGRRERCRFAGRSPRASRRFKLFAVLGEQPGVHTTRIRFFRLFFIFL